MIEIKTSGKHLAYDQETEIQYCFGDGSCIGWGDGNGNEIRLEGKGRGRGDGTGSAMGQRGGWSDDLKQPIKLKRILS